MKIDLTDNKINGRRVMPRVCELAYVLRDGPMKANEIIPRLFGVIEPEDAGNALKQIAFRARESGVKVIGTRGNGGGYRLG